MNASRKLFAVLIISLLLTLATAYAAYATCQRYSNSTMTYYSGYGWVCGGWGSGCTECVDERGGSCVTNGTKCQPFHDY